MREIAELNRTFEIATKSREFFECCRYTGLAKGRRADAVLLAKQDCATERVIRALQQRAAMGTSQGGSGTWGSELVPLSLAFVASLASVGCFDAALAFMKTLPLQTQIAVTVAGASGNAVAEGALKVISEIALANATLLEEKAVAALVASDSLLRLGGPGAQQQLFTELRTAVAGQSDAVFIDMLIDGLTPIPSVSDPLTDLAELAEGIGGKGSGSRLFAVVDSTNAVRLSFARGSSGTQTFPQMTVSGGTISGVTVQVSDEIAADQVLMFDAAQIAANAGRVDEASSGQANIDLGGGVIIGTWQRNQLSIRVERTFGAEKLRVDAAAVLNGVDWTVIV